MTDWWKENGPPVYMSVAGRFGLLKKKSTKSNNLDELLSMAGASGIIG